MKGFKNWGDVKPPRSGWLPHSALTRYAGSKLWQPPGMWSRESSRLSRDHCPGRKTGLETELVVLGLCLALLLSALILKPHHCELIHTTVVCYSKLTG